MNDQSAVDKAMLEIRKHPVFRSLVPMEAGVGWPVPIRRNGSVYLCIPFFGLQPAKDGNPILIYPPFATITLSWPNLVVVEYVNLRWKKIWSEKELSIPAGKFPHPTVAGLKLAEYNEMHGRLMWHYENMLNAKIDEAGLKEFKQLLAQMMEPALLPYYRKLFTKFYDHFLPELSVT